CSFPGCTRPPEWCERHHVVAWVDGGRTDLTNLTLLCGYHHHNYANRGWTCRINTDGLPEWTPPRWVDPKQTPIINQRILSMVRRR
ncbi:MAG TPA: HNH endonuclease signature motif containing protein, partial [Propionibacteriaceae bacterium]